MNQKEEISKAGYEEMLRLDKVDREKMKEQAKNDLMGFLYNVPDCLEPEARKESREEKRIFHMLTVYLEDGQHPFELKDHICELANEYGLAADENGFRRGFKAAMRLCMEGLNQESWY